MAREKTLPVRPADTCTGCGACLRACAAGALAMRRDGQGFACPARDMRACTGCGACRKICPVESAQTRLWLAVFAARSLDEGIRGASSSGGAFTALAQGVLARGGVVFGAAWADGDPAWALAHAAAEDAASLARLRGSKYLQSDAVPSYAQVRDALRAGRSALFSGTPCQVAGLYVWLGGDQPGLLTVDLVCHGTPSPTVFAAYLQGLEAARGQRVTHYSFRDKRRGWQHFCAAARFAQGEDYVAGQDEDPYLRIFLQNVTLRPSCYACPYAGEKRPADITLGDLWGAERLLPEWDDDRGLSLILVNTEKGRQAMADAAPALWTQPVEARSFVRFNPCIERPVAPHPLRERFFRVFAKKGFDAAAQAALRSPGQARRLVAKIAARLRRLR
ncbi:MAG: Coenzyme F420 hydrogenase/dehydrogenase, beta subunit C-terminal domain [Oscillospiraceae bacterium]|jgi:coenzyme F420-reducing hydrogenase beta subunit|nr:Coenzyme F420 hydrogenase/dehydrogenase, beta subunit C-terminal domain [Oscillospiraceae bacterium]